MCSRALCGLIKGDKLTLLKAENVARHGEREGFVQEGVVFSLLQFR